MNWGKQQQFPRNTAPSSVPAEITALGLVDFESPADCASRNHQMLRRLVRHGTATAQLTNKICVGYPPPEDWYKSSFDGDWFASRHYRAVLIPQAHALLSDHPGPLFFITIVHPKWELPVGRLDKTRIGAAIQWLRRRLRLLHCPVLVVGSYEASLRTELNRDTYWAGHLHFVIAGAHEDVLKKVLKIERRYLKRRYEKPVKVLPIGALAKRLGYSTKRIAKRDIAYIGQNGRQQRRELPLITKHQIEFDLWLLGLPAGSRTILLGCRLHHGELRLTERRVDITTNGRSGS